MKKKIKWVLLGLAVLMGTLGCSAEKPAPKESAVETKDELILAVGGEPEGGFDPTTGWGRYGSPLFQSTLLKRDDDLNVVKDLATQYDVSSDGLTWTFEIREDAQFSNGEPVTVEDVKFTFETARASGSTVDLSVLDKIEITDARTIVFYLEHPQSTFVNNAICLGIVPQKGYTEGYAMAPVGSGPYKFVQWDKGQQLIVERNELYYGEKPQFKKITFLYLTEEAAFAAAQAGQVDIAAVVPAMANQKVEGMVFTPIKSVDNRGIAFPCVKSGGKDKNGYPLGNDVTADPAIRKAIDVAIDRKELVSGILNGYGSPAYTVCDGLPWWNGQSGIVDADFDQAKEILEAGGWIKPEHGGTLEKGKLKAAFTLLYPAGDQTRQSLAIAVADRINPLGIEVTVEGKSWDEIEKDMHSNAVVFGWGSHDPLEMYNLYHSKNAGKEYYNPCYYSNKTVDAYLDSAQGALTEQEAVEFWKKAQWDGTTGFSSKGDAPWVWLVNIDHLFLVNDKLDIGKQRIQPHGHGWPITNNIEQWHWKE